MSGEARKAGRIGINSARDRQPDLPSGPAGAGGVGSRRDPERVEAFMVKAIHAG